MMLFGYLVHHRLVCPLIVACILINLVIMICYVTSHGNNSNSNGSSSERLSELKDDNGMPLFLHDPPPVSDDHRNSLKHPHPFRRVKISLHSKITQHIEVPNDSWPQSSRVGDSQGLSDDSRLQNSQVSDNLGLGDDSGRRGSQVGDNRGWGVAEEVERQEVNYRRSDAQDGDGDADNKPSLMLDDLTDNAEAVMRLNQQRVIPLQTALPKAHQDTSGSNQNLAAVDVESRLQLIKQRDEMASQMRGRDPDKPDPGTVKVLFSPSSMCEENNEVYLLIAVVSDIRRFNLRNAIRRTWGRSAASGRFATRLIFVMGKPKEPQSPLNKMIIAENKQFKDILYLDLEDKHTVLTYKTLAMFQWTLEYCNQARYVLKCDDDVFLNIPNILQDLKLMQGKQPLRFMLGHVIEGAKPITDRQDKWFLPGGQFMGKTYPPYISGSTYVFPSILLESLMQRSRETKIFWLEDVYITGILGKDVMATLVHNSKFEFRKRKLGPCRFKRLNSAHNLSAEDLVFVWREMNRMSLKCANTDDPFLRSLDY